MATAQTIIDRALRLIGAIGSGESPTSDESNDALTALNAMIESWSTERLSIFAYQNKTFTLVPNDATITMGGTTPNVDTRPERIENLYVTEGGFDYQVELVNADRWAAIGDKTTTSNLPSLAYYEPTYPQGVLNLWPVPNTANTLTIQMWITLTAFSTLATSVSLPKGYERALAYNLAVEIAAEYQLQVPQQVQMIAMESYGNIKRANQRSIISYPELYHVVGARDYDIYADV